MTYKHYLIGCIFLASTLILGGCDMDETIRNTEEKVSTSLASIPVPFEWFKKDPEAAQELPIPEIKGLILADEKVDGEGLEAFQKKVAEISEALKNEVNFQDIVDGDKVVFNILGSGNLSMRYGEEGDALTETIKEIGKTPHQSINSVTLRAYGERLGVKEEKTPYALIDLNAINDTEDFHIHTILLSMDESGSITSSTRTGKPTDKPHTATPLTKSSLLYEDTHQEFELNLQRVIRSLSNPSIYEQIQVGELKPTDTSITALTKRVGIESKNATTIYSLVEVSKGSFAEWGITGYLYDDKDVKAVTRYELVVADESGKHFYTVHYDRGLKKITNISIGSPFEEVYSS